MKHSSFFWVSLMVLGALLTGLPSAHAEEEFRFKLDLDYNVLRGKRDHLSFRPMVRTEQRFRNEGLVLLKVFVGARADLLPWLRLQSYYAHKDKFLDEHKQVHMAVFDVIFHSGIGPLKISDQNGNEWHSVPGFYRYRNNLELSAKPGRERLRLFVADEVRFDSDQARMNMNDLEAGLDLAVDRQLHLKAYYDLESNRRSLESWAHTHVVQLMLIMRLEDGRTEKR